jgi:hypothetical protein
MGESILVDGRERRLVVLAEEGGLFLRGELDLLTPMPRRRRRAHDRPSDGPTLSKAILAETMQWAIGTSLVASHRRGGGSDEHPVRLARKCDGG